MDDLNFDSDKKSEGAVALHSLKGEIRRIVYTSDDQAYTVLRILDSNSKEQTVVGPISGAYEGQNIELSGHWESHKEHGRQFRAVKYSFVLPSSPDGIKRYLASGVIPGIGPKFAEAIVDYFGKDTLNVIGNYSSRLLEIPGFGKKKLEMLRTAWREHQNERDIYIFLQSLGISQAYCTRIYRRYGDSTPLTVKENPYRLAEEVDGIGFIMSDRIAAGLGIDKNHDARLCAGAIYALNRLSEAGHICYPKSEFLEYVAKLLDVENEKAKRGLELAVENKCAIVEAWNDPSADYADMVYSTFLHNAEKELAYQVSRISGSKYPRGKRMLECKFPQGGRELNEDQMQAVDMSAKSPFSIITGGPGVGKTTVVGEIVRRAKFAKLKILLAAPTGRASKRLGESSGNYAMTIHRMLKWDPASRTFTYNASRNLNCDILIVDEVSMLDVPLALNLLRAVKTGTTLIMVGDADQLPSVGPGNFLNDLISSGKFTVTHLTKIYRQAEGSRIITNAHEVNAGRMPDLTQVPKDQIADFYWIDQNDPEKATAIISEMFTKRIPERFNLTPAKDIQVITPMNRGTCGTGTLNRILQERINPHDIHKPQISFGETIYRSGDKVMQTSNNYDKSVFNGDLGRIVHINYSEKKFTVAFDTGDVQYEFSEADQITLAYAVTVHKSQGCEFPAVIAPVLTQHFIMLHRNLIYTAMTRARKLLVMIGSRKALAIAVKNFRVEPRYSMLIRRITDTCFS